MILCLLASAAVARGGLIEYELDEPFGASSARPEGPTPWLVVTLDDGGTDGSVTLTLAATNLTDSEFVSKWYLNLDPDLDPCALVFSAPSKTGSFDVDVQAGPDEFKAGGDGYFDLLFSFGVSNAGGGTKRFGEGESVEYTVTGIDALTADSFDFCSTSKEPGDGLLRTAAHVQSIGSGEESGWISETPDPASALLLGVGAVGLAFCRRRGRSA